LNQSPRHEYLLHMDILLTILPLWGSSAITSLSNNLKPWPKWSYILQKYIYYIIFVHCFVDNLICIFICFLLPFIVPDNSRQKRGKFVIFIQILTLILIPKLYPSELLKQLFLFLTYLCMVLSHGEYSRIIPWWLISFVFSLAFQLSFSVTTSLSIFLIFTGRHPTLMFTFQIGCNFC
jgi:hypothetical protein